MPDNVEIQPVQKSNIGAIVVVVIFATLLVAALWLVVDLRGRVSNLEASLQKQGEATKSVENRVLTTDRNVAAGLEALGSKVGMTQEELAKRTSDLKAQQERSAARLAAEQQATNKQVANVSNDVSGVKTELGGAKTDIATTRTDLDATQKQLQSALGDLNVHSGLIAKNHDELEFLKHKGDRNYTEFTLKKKGRQPVSTISLDLKKTDPKRSRFTLDVFADDHTIEKKDRTLGEPLQFYTGRDRQLYEVVIFTVGKDTISGYLSTPK
jgi:hypothetical protein